MSVIIKALNEEANIGRSIEAAIRAVQPLAGEVVLADSASTDNTLAIGSSYPIRVVTLANPAERRCGAGAQLGYLHCDGDFVCIVDGDMALQDGFVEAAVKFMQDNPDVVGVGGDLIEHNTESLEYLRRNNETGAHHGSGEVDRLNGCGVYRRSALAASGYFTHRGLHSYEEFELAVRLRSSGGRFWRLAMPSVDHDGHRVAALSLLIRRWKNQYSSGIGELVRITWGTDGARLVWREVSELRLYLAVVCCWVSIAAITLLPLSISQKIALIIGMIIVPFAAMSVRKRSFEQALFSVASWSFNAAGLVRGVFASTIDPHQPIAAKIIHDGYLDQTDLDRSDTGSPAGMGARSLSGQTRLSDTVI